QHLNKILKEIRAAIDSAEGSAGLTEAEVREIVGSSIPSPTRPRAFTLTLEGDVTGSARITGNDTALVTTLDAAVVEEVPADGMAYWRRFGEWEVVPTAISSLSTVETPGFLVL